MSPGAIPADARGHRRRSFLAGVGWCGARRTRPAGARRPWSSSAASAPHRRRCASSRSCSPAAAPRQTSLALPAPRESNPGNQSRAFLRRPVPSSPAALTNGSRTRASWIPWYHGPDLLLLRGCRHGRALWPVQPATPTLAGLDRHWSTGSSIPTTTTPRSPRRTDECSPARRRRIQHRSAPGRLGARDVLIDHRTLRRCGCTWPATADEGYLVPWSSPAIVLRWTARSSRPRWAATPVTTRVAARAGRVARGLYYLSGDWVVCGSGRFAFRAADTPLVDLAQHEHGPAGRATSVRLALSRPV